MSDVHDSCVSFQELINRHLITMAQIDHSENPGKGCGLNINGHEQETQFLPFLCHLFICLKFLRPLVVLLCPQFFFSW